MVERFTFGLILTDIDMPLMDGPLASGGPWATCERPGRPCRRHHGAHPRGKGAPRNGGRAQGIHSKAFTEKDL